MNNLLHQQDAANTGIPHDFSIHSTARSLCQDHRSHLETRTEKMMSVMQSFLLN